MVSRARSTCLRRPRPARGAVSARPPASSIGSRRRALLLEDERDDDADHVETEHRDRHDHLRHHVGAGTDHRGDDEDREEGVLEVLEQHAPPTTPQRAGEGVLKLLEQQPPLTTPMRARKSTSVGISKINPNPSSIFVYSENASSTF